MAEETYDVIVVGAGFGGSTCAALLAKRGLKVLLLEKNARAGGKAMALSKEGFTYTAWVVICAPTQGNLFEVVLKELGMEDKVELVAPGVSGTRYKSSSGQYVMGPQDPTPNPDNIFDWLELREAEREEALRLLADLTLLSPQNIDALDDVSFHDWLGRYNVPKGLYAFLVAPVSDGCFMVPVDTVAASEALRSIQALFLRSGGLFAKGGIGRVAEIFSEAVEVNGGRSIMRVRVEKITVDQGRVTGVATDKGTFQAPIVVSNAGIQPTVLKLVGEEHFDRGYVNYVRDLIPSWGMMGVRYFLNKQMTDDPYGTIFSSESCWSLDRWLKAKSGDIPKDVTVWFEVPSNYDPGAAPPGKQMIMTGLWCPADPQMTEQEKQVWWDKSDEIMFRVFPDMPLHIESKEGYSTHDVSALTRDQVLPRIGGECIGLGQVIGQCGHSKPSTKAPIQGLFYVGCDAGGNGIGVQQAIDSAIKLTPTVLQYHRVRQTVQ